MGRVETSAVSVWVKPRLRVKGEGGVNPFYLLAFGRQALQRTLGTLRAHPHPTTTRPVSQRVHLTCEDESRVEETPAYTVATPWSPRHSGQHGLLGRFFPAADAVDSVPPKDQRSAGQGPPSLWLSKKNTFD